MSVPNSSAGAIFKAAYIASKDPNLQAAYLIDDPVVRLNTMYALALKGIAIDVMIDVNGADPLLMHQFRQNVGLLWVPNALQPSLEVQLTGSQQPDPPFYPYDPAHPPVGAIITDTNPADYKAFPLPAAPVPADPAINPTPAAGDKLVGPAKTSTLFDLTPLARHKALTDGFVWTLEGDGHVYMFHASLMANIWQRLS
jgi:hypothetical protein